MCRQRLARWQSRMSLPQKTALYERLMLELEHIAFNRIQTFTSRREAAFAKHNAFTSVGEFN